MGYVGNGSVHRRNHARIRRNLSTGRSIFWRHIGALSGLPDGHYISYKQRYSQDNSRDAPLATRTTGCSNTSFHFNQWCIRYKLATLANNIFFFAFLPPVLRQYFSDLLPYNPSWLRTTSANLLTVPGLKPCHQLSCFPCLCTNCLESHRQCHSWFSNLFHV